MLYRHAGVQVWLKSPGGTPVVLGYCGPVHALVSRKPRSAFHPVATSMRPCTVVLQHDWLPVSELPITTSVRGLVAFVPESRGHRL